MHLLVVFAFFALVIAAEAQIDDVVKPPVKVPTPLVKVPTPPVKVPTPPVKAPTPPVKAPTPPVKVPTPPVKLPIPPVKLPKLPIKLPGQCLLEQCGPKDGFFTHLCTTICTTSQFSKGGKCTYQKEGKDGKSQRAQCACSGSLGNAKFLLDFNCLIFCGSACITCGFTGGQCTKATSSSVGCTCT